MERITKVGESTIIGAGGEYSDFQKIQHILGDLTGTDRVRGQYVYKPLQERKFDSLFSRICLSLSIFRIMMMGSTMILLRFFTTFVL